MRNFQSNRFYRITNDLNILPFFQDLIEEKNDLNCVKYKYRDKIVCNEKDEIINWEKINEDFNDYNKCYGEKKEIKDDFNRPQQEVSEEKNVDNYCCEKNSEENGEIRGSEKVNINHSQKEKEDEYIHPQKEVSKEKSGGVDKKYYKNTSEKNYEITDLKKINIFQRQKEKEGSDLMDGKEGKYPYLKKWSCSIF